MPARAKRDRRRRSVHVTPAAVALFRQGFNLLRGQHDRHELHDLKIAYRAGPVKVRRVPVGP